MIYSEFENLDQVNSYRQVEDEDVRCVPHRLVQHDDKDDQEVPNEPDDNTQLVSKQFFINIVTQF